MHILCIMQYIHKQRKSRCPQKRKTHAHLGLNRNFTPPAVGDITNKKAGKPAVNCHDQHPTHTHSQCTSQPRVLFHGFLLHMYALHRAVHTRAYAYKYMQPETQPPHCNDALSALDSNQLNSIQLLSLSCTTGCMPLAIGVSFAALF
jgi:hypothetical protein